MKFIFAKNSKNESLVLYKIENSDNLIISLTDMHDNRVIHYDLTPQQAAHMAAAILNSYGYDRVS